MQLIRDLIVGTVKAFTEPPIFLFLVYAVACICACLCEALTAN